MIEVKIKVINASILTPHSGGLRLILSPNNLQGDTKDHPLYSLFDKKWKRVKEDAKGWYSNKTGEYKLGAIFQTAVQSDTWVIHMLCQDLTKSKKSITTDVVGLTECLSKVAKLAKYESASIHVSSFLIKAIPKLDLLLKSEILSKGLAVSIYEEP